MEGMTDFIASRGSHGFYSPPEDGVVHLPEMGQVLEMGLVLDDEEAGDAAQEAAKEEAADGTAKSSKWATSKVWFNNVFQIPDDDPDANERRQELILKNWVNLREKGDTLVDDDKVKAGAADLGVETGDEQAEADAAAAAAEAAEEATEEATAATAEEATAPAAAKPDPPVEA